MHDRAIGNVSNDLDFNSLKGCKMKCNFKLHCGHFCNQACHIEDSSHLMVNCLFTCQKSVFILILLILVNNLLFAFKLLFYIENALESISVIKCVTKNVMYVKYSQV